MGHCTLVGQSRDKVKLGQSSIVQQVATRGLRCIACRVGCFAELVLFASALALASQSYLLYLFVAALGQFSCIARMRGAAS